MLKRIGVVGLLHGIKNSGGGTWETETLDSREGRFLQTGKRQAQRNL